MCGLAGLYLKRSSIPEHQALVNTLVKMTDTLTHRGPDSSGHIVNYPIAFGHRRLSILDLSENGAQPMKLGENGPVITYNGEVYNFQDLRRELEDQGCKFRGHSDTEVILHVYAVWGFSGLKRLEGIFALALWDPAHKRLVLMRDRFGVKPLFYGDSTHGLAFGSEIKAVLAAGGVDFSLDDQSLSEYLWYGNTHEDRTFYNGVRAVEPGHWLIIEDGVQRIESWWRIEEWLEQPVVAKNIKDASNQVRLSLDQAVSRQLVADVPVGIFLSGGVDSSAIAASAIQSSQKPLNSYVAGFDFDKGVNELPKAAIVARHLGLIHHELHVSGSGLSDVLLTLARAHDEPFADAANIPLYLMCRQLSGEMKVVLQGDGGDELFAGYRRYAMLRNALWWRFWPKTLSPVARACGSLGGRFARVADLMGSNDMAMRMAYLLTLESPHNPPESFLMPERRHDLAKMTDPFIAYRRAALRFRHHDPVQQMLLTDLTVQLPSQFLTKVDRSTMAAGIEARVPLLDESVVRLAVNMPSHWKVRGIQKKIILRDSQRGRLPPEILNGPKTGFGVPFEYWLRDLLFEFARERLLDSTFTNAFGLDRWAIERALIEHRAQHKNQGMILWKLLQLAIWHSLKV